MTRTIPDLRSICAPRHPGVSRAVCDSYAEAADVCFSRYHNPPETLLSISCRGSSSSAGVHWNTPDEAAELAWNNRDDATRDAAYIVSLAAVESELGLVALSRAETRTGADYYVGETGAVDLENAYRLEVSGLDKCTNASARRRLVEKLEQAARGNSNLPAFASVVCFQRALVMVEAVREES